MLIYLTFVRISVLILGLYPCKRWISMLIRVAHPCKRWISVLNRASHPSKEWLSVLIWVSHPCEGSISVLIDFMLSGKIVRVLTKLSCSPKFIPSFIILLITDFHKNIIRFNFSRSTSLAILWKNYLISFFSIKKKFSFVRTIFLFQYSTKVKINLPSPIFFVQIFSFTGLCFQLLMEQVFKYGDWRRYGLSLVYDLRG